MTNKPSTHSHIGASTCERWWNCPGSVLLMENLPPFPGSKYTAEGTVAHMLGEKELLKTIHYHTCEDQDAIPQKKLPGSLEDEVGRSYVEDGYEIEVSDGMVEAVQVYIDTVVDYMLEYRLHWGQNIKTEVRFDLTHIDPEAFGTCDTAITVPFGPLIVIDYKHGQGHAVEVKDNYQLMYYALGAYYELREALRHEVVSIDLVVVQPRAKHLDGPVRKQTISVENLLGFEEELKRAISRLRRKATDLKTGPWCKFCQAKPVCPAQRKEREREAECDFSGLETSVVELPQVQSLTPERLSKLMTNAQNIKSWVDSIINLCTISADRGVEIPEYKLVTKYGNRRWKSEGDVETAFGLEFGEKIYNKKIKTPAQMEKILKGRKEELEPYWEKPVTGTTLVSMTDNRESVSTTAENDFKEYAIP